MKFLLIASAAGAALAMAPAVAQTVQPAPPTGQRALKVETRADAQARAQKVFAHLDANRDGFITKQDMDAVEAQRAAKQKQRAARQEQRAQRRDPAKVFARLDANNDGQITPAEAQAARTARVQRKGGQQPAKAQAVALGNLFARADTNRDGNISRAEFAAAPQPQRKTAKQAVRRDGRGRLFAASDANKDGRVSLPEVQQLLLQRFDRLDSDRDGTVKPEERNQARAQRRPS